MPCGATPTVELRLDQPVAGPVERIQGLTTLRMKGWRTRSSEAAVGLVPRCTVSSCEKHALNWEPVIGIEPMACRLQDGRSAN